MVVTAPIKEETMIKIGNELIPILIDSSTISLTYVPKDSLLTKSVAMNMRYFPRLFNCIYFLAQNKKDIMQ